MANLLEKWITCDQHKWSLILSKFPCIDGLIYTDNDNIILLSLPKLITEFDENKELVEMMVKEYIEIAKQEDVLLKNNLIKPTWENPVKKY